MSLILWYLKDHAIMILNIYSLTSVSPSYQITIPSNPFHYLFKHRPNGSTIEADSAKIPFPP